MAMMATAGIGYGSRGLYAGQAPYPGMYPSAGPSSQGQAGDAQESTYLYIPNNAVGAIIGTKVSQTRKYELRYSTFPILGIAHTQHYPFLGRVGENRTAGRDQAARGSQRETGDHRGIARSSMEGSVLDFRKDARRRFRGRFR